MDISEPQAFADERNEDCLASFSTNRSFTRVSRNQRSAISVIRSRSKKMKSNQQSSPKLDVISSGNPQTVGESIGTALEAKIHAAEEMLPRFDNLAAHRPWWLPMGLYIPLAQKKAASLLQPVTRQHYPEMDLRLTAMADTANTSVDSLYLFHLMETVSNPTEDRTLTPAATGCSALAIKSLAGSANMSILAHNFDMIPMSRKSLALRRLQTHGTLESIQFSYAPLGGVIDGINQCGLAISYNFVAVCDARLDLPPLSFAIDQALGNCRDIDEAIQWITSKPRSGGALLMLADASGDVASLEISPSDYNVRGVDHAGFLWHTNDFITPSMRRLEPSRDFVFGERCPPSLRGRRAYQSSECRFERFTKLTQQCDDITSASVERIMCDHGTGSSGDDNSICMHGGYWSTIASLRMYPQTRRLRVTYGHPCRGDYSEFAL